MAVFSDGLREYQIFFIKLSQTRFSFSIRLTRLNDNLIRINKMVYIQNYKPATLIEKRELANIKF